MCAGKGVRETMALLRQCETRDARATGRLNDEIDAAVIFMLDGWRDLVFDGEERCGDGEAAALERQ